MVLILTDQERAAPAYESDEMAAWRREALIGRQWFLDHGVDFRRHYVAATACVPSRPSLLTGHFPDVHGVTQTDGLGKRFDDSRLRWLPAGEVPTMGHWFRAAGYDTHYDGKWHVSHADLMVDGEPLATNTDHGEVIAENVERYRDADPLDPHGFSGWVGPEPHGGRLANAGIRRDQLAADRVTNWLTDRYRRRNEGDPAALRPPRGWLLRLFARAEPAARPLRASLRFGVGRPLPSVLTGSSDRLARSRASFDPGESSWLYSECVM